MDDEQARNQADMLKDLGIGSNTLSGDQANGGPLYEKEVGLPQNWRELFRRSIEDKKNIIYSDPGNLFTVGSNEFGITREYYSFDQNKGNFVPRTYAFFDEPARLAYVTIGNSMWLESKTVDFFQDKGWQSISFRGKIAERAIEVNYDTVGELAAIIFKISQALKDGAWPEETFGFISSDGFTSGDLDFKVEKIDEGFNIQRLDGGLTDEIYVPFRFDPDKVKEELFPAPLRKDPADPNVDLDNGWKNIDPFSKVGIKWTPVADDSRHSLNRSLAWSASKVITDL